MRIGYIVSSRYDCKVSLALVKNWFNKTEKRYIEREIYIFAISMLHHTCVLLMSENVIKLAIMSKQKPQKHLLCAAIF